MSTASQTFSLSSFLDRHKVFTTFSKHASPSVVQKGHKQLEQNLISLAEKVLKDPLLKQEVCERILILMKEDMKQEKERCQPTWGRL